MFNIDKTEKHFLIGFIIILNFVLLYMQYGCITSIPAKCRQNAIHSALIYEKYPTKIVISQSKDKTKKHAQAQAYIDSRWKWICTNTMEAYICNREYPDFEIIEYLSVQKFIDDYFPNAKDFNY